jgi:UDP-N-acetylmuramate--L-alanine ligase
MNTLSALALPAATRLHLVGVAGSGMQPLAVLLQEAGYQVSGTDRTDGPRITALRDLGIDALAGSHPQAVQGAAQVVASPLIPADDPEMRAARRLGIPVLARADMLAQLIATRETICVSGSHGKTTTSALLTHILRRAGRDPGFMVGGAAPSLGPVAARLGAPQSPFVLEACEAFGALAAWQPRHIILTNIDDEHSDDYAGISGLAAAFRSYIDRLPTNGVLVACGDDPGVTALLTDQTSRAQKQALTYGFGPANRLRVATGAEPGCVDLTLDGMPLGQIRLPLPGRHLVLNAVAAAGMALTMGVDWPDIAAAIASFAGVARRMQRIGETGGIPVLDDFAHHPTEVAATIEATRALLPQTKRLVVVLEAQRHKRMVKLAKGYAKALRAADLVLLMPVDGACRTQGHDGQALLIAALTEQGVAFRSIAGPEVLAEVP